MSDHPHVVDAHPGMEDLISVRREISRYRRQAAAERLALYRKHLQVTVTRATPLLARIAREDGFDLKGALMKLRPPGGWPDRVQVLGGLERPRMIRRMFGARLAIWPFSSGQAVMVRDGDHPAGALSVGLNQGAVELLLTIGRVLVATREGQIVLSLPFAVPEAVAGAATGRSVGDLVGHRWFADPRWVIDRVRGEDLRTTIWVRADHEPFRMPWRRLLGGGSGFGGPAAMRDRVAATCAPEGRAHAIHREGAAG